VTPSIRDVWRTSPAASDVDATDPGLRSALANLQSAPALATHLAAAQEYRRLGILDRAFDHLKAGALFDEHDPAVNDALARTWRDWGLPGMGLSNAYRAVYAAPRSAIPRHTLATLLLALGKRADAEAALREVVRLDPSAWYGWHNLCRMVMADGRTQEAIPLCQRAETARREHVKAAGHERN
jgi:predicted Zn-dependent protease